MHRRPLLLCVWLAALLGGPPGTATRQPAEGWESIFDGRNLAGWTRSGGSRGRITVADGSLVLEGDAGWLLHTGRILRSFSIECEFRIEHPETNLAFLVRAWPAVDDDAGSQTGNAFQLTGGNVFSAQFLAIGRERSAVPVTSPAFHAAGLRVGSWHRFRCDCLDDVCTFSLNGARVAIATADLRPAGYVGFELAGGRAAVRDVRLRPPVTTPWKSIPVCGENGLSTPSLIEEVKPLYPAEANARKLTGTVLLEFVVLSDGRTGGIRVERSLDRKFGLDRAAIEAVYQWRFDPATRSGRPVDCVAVAEVNFKLHR